MHYTPHCLPEVFTVTVGPINLAKLLQPDITVTWVAMYVKKWPLIPPPTLIFSFEKDPLKQSFGTH